MHVHVSRIFFSYFSTKKCGYAFEAIPMIISINVLVENKKLQYFLLKK